MQTSSQPMYLSWIRNAKVIVGYNSGRNVHFPSISDLIERPFLIVTFIIYSLKFPPPLMNFFIEQGNRAKIGRVFLNLPVFLLLSRFLGFWLYKIRLHIYLILMCISNEKVWTYAAMFILCYSNFILGIPTLLLLFMVLSLLYCSFSILCCCLPHPFTINELLFFWVPGL